MKKLGKLAILILFSSISIIISIDRGAIAAVLPSLELELNFGEIKAGLLGSSFMFGYMLASPIFACLSRKFTSHLLIFAGLSIWVLSVFVSSLCNTYSTLLLFRSLTGIGEASFSCFAPVIILDSAPVKYKNRWLALYFSTGTLGFALGYILGGQIDIYFGWRTCFIGMSFVMLPLALVSLCTKHEEFVKLDPDSYSSVWGDLKLLLCNEVYIYLVLGYSAFVFTIGGLGYWV